MYSIPLGFFATEIMFSPRLAKKEDAIKLRDEASKVFFDCVGLEEDERFGVVSRGSKLVA